MGATLPRLRGTMFTHPIWLGYKTTMDANGNSRIFWMRTAGAQPGEKLLYSETKPRQGIVLMDIPMPVKAWKELERTMKAAKLPEISKVIG